LRTPLSVLSQTPLRPLASSPFHHKPNPEGRPNSKLEAAYHKTDKAIENIVNPLHAA
jgi:hypothetical protein